jgi:hypothetical protein
VSVGESGAPSKEGDAIVRRENVGILRLAHPIHELAFFGADRGPVGRAIRRDNAAEAVVGAAMLCFRRADERLGRNAPDVHTCSAQCAGFD